jgi:hypothetical protein
MFRTSFMAVGLHDATPTHLNFECVGIAGCTTGSPDMIHGSSIPVLLPVQTVGTLRAILYIQICFSS